MIFIMIIFVSCSNVSKETSSNVSSDVNSQNESTSLKNTNEKSEVNIYVPDENAEYLVPLVQNIEPTPENSVKCLISLEEACFPKETELVGIEIKENTAYVNLNKEFYEAPVSDLEWSLNLMSIVHTLCLNDSFSIEQVQFLIEGESKDMNILQPVKVNEAFIKPCKKE